MSSPSITARVRILLLSPAGRRVTLWLVPVATPAGEEPRVRVLSLPTPRFQALDVRLGDLVRLGVTPAGKPSLLGAVREEARHA